jgi:hypothetical protein
LTLKAVLIGAILAIVLGSANAYFGLYAGMTVSAAIPGAVMAFALLRPFKATILEIKIGMMGAAAGTALAAGVIFTIPAMLLLNAWSDIQYLETTIIAALGGILGVLWMVMLRRALIIKTDLPFPEGVAVAAVLTTTVGNDHKKKKGHGGATAWGVRYPSDCTGAAPQLTKLGIFQYYQTTNMNFLRNRHKLPITVVGGCYNGQFDISISKNGLAYSNCWAWKLTSKWGGGSIATIANTALGTHAMNDADQDDVNDYLEVLDGWLELRFFQLYSHEKVDTLGNLHSGAIKDYLHTFINSGDEMDLKMVQQWELFRDPSLKVGGCQ